MMTSLNRLVAIGLLANRRFAIVAFVSAAVVSSIASPPALGQEDERYDFDGVDDKGVPPADPTDWMTSANWSDGGFDPVAEFGPLIPDEGTRVEIQTSTVGVNAPVIGPGDAAEAFGVRIGRFGGEGLLIMTGGTLDLPDSCNAFPFTCNRRIRVGAANVGDDAFRNPGTFDLSGGVVSTDTLWIGSGSQGTLNMTGGVVNTRGNFYLDWTFDAESVLNLSGGTINVGTVLRLYRNSSLNLSGGELLIDGAAELGTETALSESQVPSVAVSISDGLLQAGDFLQIGGSVVLDGGIVRAESFNETLSIGTLEINEGGTLQFAQESIADIENLITEGFLTTSSPLGTDGFVIEIVDVDGSDFTQVAFASGSLPADFDKDGDIDGDDFLIWQANFGAASATSNTGDADGDGDVDGDDFLVWQAGFGTVGGQAAAAIPEPASGWLLATAVGLCGGLARRRAATGR